jgi:hypothetical protein
MPDPSRHPDTFDDSGVEPGRTLTTGASRWQKVVGIIGLVVALWVGNEMYNVIVGDFAGGPGPGGHGPGGGETPIETPIEDQEQEIDTEDDGGHDPSQFDHG